jgi:hypothetical protein
MEIDPSPIKNTGDFRTYVLLLANGKGTPIVKSLEEYLRALWSLIQQAQGKPVTYAVLGHLLHDAFSAEILPFNEQWLQYEAPPDLDEDESEISLPRTSKKEECE